MSSEQSYSRQSQTTAAQQTSDFTDHERDVTGYLFAKLFALYANAFYLVYPSKKEVVFAKAQYAKDIGKYSREQIDEAMKHLARLAVSPDKENRIYKEPNVLAVLAMMDESVKRDRAHQLFLPVPKESDEEKERRLELGRVEAARLLALFDEPKPTKQQTQADIDDMARLERLKNE